MTANDRDLDQQLRALFAAPELDVQPRPGAVSVVLTRVARVRRRRRAAQATGVLVLAAVLSFAVVNTSVIKGRASGAVPAAHPTATASSTYTELVMSGSAVGALRLGMTLAQAKATGLLNLSTATTNNPRPGCTQYDGNHGIVSVNLDRDVVTAIGVYEFIHTTEGRAIGDTYALLHATYPRSVPATPDRHSTSYRVPLPAHPDAWYVFTLDVGADTGHPSPPTQTSRVLQLALASNDRHCS